MEKSKIFIHQDILGADYHLLTFQDLTETKYKSESTIREMRSKISGLEEETLRQKQELQSLRKNNAGLDSDYHEQEKVSKIHRLCLMYLYIYNWLVLLL